MKATTKVRIYKNWYNGTATIIGRYIYSIHAHTGEILRANREDVDREWIDDRGMVRGAWEGTGEYI